MVSASNSHSCSYGLVKNQQLNDEQQVSFSSRFGKLELPLEMDVLEGSQPEITRISNVDIDGSLLPTESEKVIYDRGNKGLLAAKKRYNRYKPGHPAGFIEAFANLYSDLAVDLKNHRKKNKKNNYTFDLEDSEQNIKFFVASSKSNSFGLWTKI